MPDYDQMLLHLDGVEKALKKSVESMHPISRLSHLESYVLGHLRGMEAVLKACKDAVTKTRALKESPPIPKDEAE